MKDICHYEPGEIITSGKIYGRLAKNCSILYWSEWCCKIIKGCFTDRSSLTVEMSITYSCRCHFIYHGMEFEVSDFWPVYTWVSVSGKKLTLPYILSRGKWRYLLHSFTFLSHLFPLPCGAGSTVPARGSTQVLLCLFPGVLWLWHFLYSVLRSRSCTSSIKPPYIHFRCVAGIDGGCG